MNLAETSCSPRTLAATLMAALASLVASHTPAVAQSKPLIQWHADSNPAAIHQPAKLRVDHQVAPVALAEPSNSTKEKTLISTTEPPRAISSADPPSEFRKLAPPSGKKPLLGLGKQENNNALSLAAPQMESLTTAGAGLAIVVGLFLLCSWLFRRAGPKASSPLPKDAVAVLGRIPLAGSHFAHLVKLGNKLILVAVGPDSVSTLAEVSDPNEVQNLLSLCIQNHNQSTSAEFQQVLQQLAKEPASGFLEKNTAAAAYARSRRT